MVANPRGTLCACGEKVVRDDLCARCYSDKIQALGKSQLPLTQSSTDYMRPREIADLWIRTKDKAACEVEIMKYPEPELTRKWVRHYIKKHVDAMKNGG